MSKGWDYSHWDKAEHKAEPLESWAREVARHAHYAEYHHQDWCVAHKTSHIADCHCKGYVVGQVHKVERELALVNPTLIKDKALMDVLVPFAERFGIESLRRKIQESTIHVPPGNGHAPELIRERDPARPPAVFSRMENWDSEPVPERKWAILNRVPIRQAGLFSGEGGTGKSIIELMKDVAHAAGKDWLGSMPEPGPAIYIGAEDDEDEIHIRLAAIASHYGVTFKELVEGGFHLLCLMGQDATLCAAGKNGKVETTALYRQIYEMAGDIKPKNISIDTLSRAFAGNEIDRVQVHGFAMHMQALAMAAGGSVTILSHPSLAGVASGSGISGSTAWHGAFRFRQYLKGCKPADGDEPDNDLRELEFKKNQYGPIGEKLVLRYKRGLFLPVAGMSVLETAAAEAKAEQAFLDMLRRFTAQGRNVSHQKTSQNYAPRVFAKESNNFKIADFEVAMNRIFNVGKIRVEPYGRWHYNRIVEA